MSRARIVVVVAFLVGGLALTLVFPGALTAGKRNQTVYLRATFRDAITDKVTSDGKGQYANAPFITDRRAARTVQGDVLDRCTRNCSPRR